MKVLILAPHIHCNINKKFEKRDSGFGRVVYQIAKEVAQKKDVSVLTYLSTAGKKIGDVRFIRNSLFINLIKSSKKDVLKNFKLVIKQKNFSFKRKISFFLKLSLEQSIYDKIKKENPNIIHLHGMTIETLPILRAIVRSKIPFTLTLHGMNYANIEAIEKGDFVKEFEIEIIKFLLKNNVKVTVLTNKTKELIKKDFYKEKKVDQTKNIVVIPNGIVKNYNDLSNISIKEDIKKVIKKYEKRKIILAVGSLGIRKNQIFLLKSLLLLSDKIKGEICVIVCGSGSEEMKLKEFVERKKLSNIVTFLGNVENDQLRFLYSKASFLSVTSLTEGFGIPVLEALMFGNEIISLEDLEFINEIKSYKFCNTINIRQEKSFAKLIELCVSKPKDESKDEIRIFLKKYYWGNVINKYIDVYNSINLFSNIELKKLNNVIKEIGII